MSYHLGFGALGAPATYSGEPAPKPTRFVIDPEKPYPVTVYTTVMWVTDRDLTCRVSGVEGAFRVTPNFQIQWDDPRFYGDWDLRNDGEVHLDGVILVGDK